MELQGELSDFPLADILQIICLSKKTGTLLISGNEQKGMIVFVRGKIVQAVTDSSPASLGDLLVTSQVIGPYELEEALRLQGRSLPHRLLGSVLVELGFVQRYDLNVRVRAQIQRAIGRLIALRRGSFELRLNVVPIGRASPYPGQDIVLTEGCDVEELLLEVATAQDEARHKTGDLAMSADSPAHAEPDEAESRTESPSASFASLLDQSLDEEPEALLARLDPSAPFEGREASTGAPVTDRDRFLRLQAFLLELKNATSHAEVALTILRSAAEVASRGVLFVVRGEALWGQGQFGLPAVPGQSPSLADRRIREIRIDVAEAGMLAEAARSGAVRIGRLERTPAMSKLLEKIGDSGEDLLAAAIPMVCRGRVRVVLYIDNHPGNCEFRGLQELEVLVDQAGLVMEKILLEQRLSEIDIGHESEGR